MRTPGPVAAHCITLWCITAVVVLLSSYSSVNTLLFFCRSRPCGNFGFFYIAGVARVACCVLHEMRLPGGSRSPMGGRIAETFGCVSRTLTHL